MNLAKYSSHSKLLNNLKIVKNDNIIILEFKNITKKQRRGFTNKLTISINI